VLGELIKQTLQNLYKLDMVLRGLFEIFLQMGDYVSAVKYLQKAIDLGM
jgi:hypothetical protein